MANNLSRRATDGRRARIKSLTRARESIIDQLLIEMNQRPQSPHEVGEYVQTPDGKQRITARWYTGAKWHYQFHVSRPGFRRRFFVIYSQDEIRRRVTDPAEALQLLIDAYRGKSITPVQIQIH